MSASLLNTQLMAQNNTPNKYQGLDNTSIRTIEEVKGAIMIAKMCPRDEDLAISKILKACTRTSLAESALYEYERGGTPVEGPSIRLAEAAVMSWGNVQYGVRVLDSNDHETTYEAYAWDVENNVRASRVFTVEHARYTKAGGKRKLDDPRDIYEIVMSQAARRLRACILEIIPGDVIEMAVDACKATLLKNAGEVDKAERIKRMLIAFSNMGVTQAMIEKKFSCKVEALSETLLVKLRGIAQGVKDGFSKPEDHFEFKLTEGSGNASGLNASLGQ